MTSHARISHYELLERIGRDGPTEIFRALDLRLERHVVVKLLRREDMAHPEHLERFRREARIASLVTHPHICTVHDSGEEGGRAFLVCELLEGRALDETLAEGRLRADRTIELGIQIADAMSAAHRREVVHANLKPSNVFITTDGHAKVLELGVAGALSSTAPPDVAAVSPSSAETEVPELSAATARLGEVLHPYLSPEQVNGGDADARSDIFAIGALLYEMATGTRAFPAATAAEMAAEIVAHVPPRPRSVDRKVPRLLDQIIRRALEKAPERRYQAAAGLLDDLRHARRVADAPGRLARLRVDRLLPGWAAPAAAVLVILALAASVRWWWTSGPVPPVERSRILVSHIANGTADPDFDGTLRQAIGVYLAQSPYLDIASDERIRSTLQLMGRKADTRMSHEVAEEVCQRLGLHAMIEGSVSSLGRATAVAFAAIDCSNGAMVATRQVEVERKEDVLKAIGRLTADLRSSLGESGASLARNNVPVEEATTPSLPALKAYTEGVAQRAAGAELNAVKFLEQAIALDPRFALAYTTLSSIYGGFGETGRSEAFARLAYERRGHVSERERLFITYQYHDRVTGDQVQAREALEVWQRTYPRDYRPANALAVLLNRMGDYEGAARAAEEAMRRNPAHPFPLSNLALARRGAGRFAEARAIAEEAVSRNLATLPLRRLLYQIAELEGDQALARAQIDWADGQRRRFDFTGARAQIAAFRGRTTESRRLYAETLAAASTAGFPQISSGYGAQAALADALCNYSFEAIHRARTVIRGATVNEPKLRAATALALAGRPGEAESIVHQLRSVRPADTLLHNAYLPSAEAAALLARDQPHAAIERLRPAMPYEYGTVAALLPIYLRGEANLRAGAPDEAIRQFRVLLAHRGADPFSPLVPLAHLGLARAHARNGGTGESRKAYETLLEIWSGADADLPVLKDAREELARLRSAPDSVRTARGPDL